MFLNFVKLFANTAYPDEKTHCVVSSGFQSLQTSSCVRFRKCVVAEETKNVLLLALPSIGHHLSFSSCTSSCNNVMYHP